MLLKAGSPIDPLDSVKRTPLWHASASEPTDPTTRELKIRLAMSEMRQGIVIVYGFLQFASVVSAAECLDDPELTRPSLRYCHLN